MLEHSQQNKILYIFIDEAGNFDFSEKGTSHFILTGIATLNPEKSFPLLTLKYDLFIHGPKFGESDYESFHASEDRQMVRDKVFSTITKMNHINAYSVVINKKKHINIDDDILYAKMCNQLIEDALIATDINQSTKVVIVMDKILFKNKRSNITKSIKLTTKKKFGIIPYTFFHQMKSDPNCQIADYCCWAIYVKHTRNELRPTKQLAHIKIKETLLPPIQNP